MRKVFLPFWSVTLLIVLISLFGANSASNNTYESGEESEQHPNEESSEESSVDENNENQMGAYVENDYFNYSPEQIYLLIIADSQTTLPSGVLCQLDYNHIFDLLSNPLGARLIANRFTEFFSLPDVSSFAADMIHDNFYLNLNIFSAVDYDDFIHANIPNLILLRTLNLHSFARKLNLNGFIGLLKSLPPDFVVLPSQNFLLPHLFDLPQMDYPLLYLKRGITFNPDEVDINFDSSAVNDFNTWNIALQLFKYKLINYEEYTTSIYIEDLIESINEAYACYYSLFTRSNYNYFGISDNNAMFGSISDFISLEGVTIDDIGSSVGLPDFMNVKYTDLTSQSRIRYRLVLYVALFNPNIVDSLSILNDLIVNLVTSAHANDFTKAEINFFVTECFNREFFDAISRIFRVAPRSRFRRVAEYKIGKDQAIFEKTMENIPSAVISLPFFTRWTESEFLDQGIKLKNEIFYKTRQSFLIPALSTSSSSRSNSDDEEHNSMNYIADSPSSIKRSRDGSSVVSSAFDSHFLTTQQISHFITPVNERNYNTEESFVVPCPDKEFFLERMDNLMQNLESPDFGEAAWKHKIDAMTILNPETRDVYANHEATLDDFVRKTFKIIYLVYLKPNINFRIDFEGSPSFGNGLKQETIEMFNRAILLPKYKIFHYNFRILGFVPYPLLDPQVLGMLGYLNAFSITVDQPVCWQLSSDYTKFLFYEENPHESMDDLVNTLYGKLFDNINALVDPYINPIDYFPTTFHSHQPLPFSDSFKHTPLDLFSPFDASKSGFTNLGTFLQHQTLELLDETIIIPPSKKRFCFEESKGESVGNLIDSKEDEAGSEIDLELEKEIFERSERLAKQELLKRQVVEAIIEVLTREIIEHLLIGRYYFMRMYLRAFNIFSMKFITSAFYDQLQAAHSKPFTVEEIIKGLRFTNERADIVITGSDGELLTPRQTLEMIIQTFDAKMLRTFYWFCTGCFSLPIGGLESKPIDVHVVDQLLLPSAATCYRYFKFNVQKTFLANLGALRRALLESSGYHYIETHTQRQIEATGADSMASILAQNAIDEEGQVADQIE